MIGLVKKAKLHVLEKGFTLIEMMVYMAIFLILSTASVTFLISLNDFIDQYRLETMLYRSGTNVMEQVLLSIREADQVDLLNTTLASSTIGELALENTATTTVFTLNNDDIEMSINGEEYGSLTMDGVSVDGFMIYHYDMAVGEMVRVTLEMTADLDGATQKSLTLYGGAMVRGAI